MTTVADLVAAAKATIENLDPTALLRESTSTDALVIDIREDDERHRHGAIAGSIHAPRGMLEFYADPSSPYHRTEFRRERRLILYCASGGRSALAVKALQSLGYENVAHLEGGLNAWHASGHPVAGHQLGD
jgi:rhodanese-related sulfurtransferase